MKFKCEICGFEYEMDAEHFDYNEEEIQCPHCGKIARYKIT